MPHLIPAVGTSRHTRMVNRKKLAKRDAWTPDRHRALASSGMSPDEIVAAVARDHGLSARDLTGPDIRDHVHAARIRAFRVIAEAHSDMSLVDLCRCIGRCSTSYLSKMATSPRPADDRPSPSGLGIPSDVARIIHRSAAAFGTTAKAIVGRSRLHLVTQARFHAIHAVREAKPHLSLQQIGRMFGRHHTTILNALQQMERTGVPQPGAASIQISEAA